MLPEAPPIFIDQLQKVMKHSSSNECISIVVCMVSHFMYGEVTQNLVFCMQFETQH